MVQSIPISSEEFGGSNPSSPTKLQQKCWSFFMPFFYENYVNRNQGINPKICGEMLESNKFSRNNKHQQI